MKFPSLLSLLPYYLLAADACLTETERHGGHIVDLKRHISNGIINRRQANANTIPVGTGDRFDNGNKLPRGIGSQTDNSAFNTVLNLAEIKSAVLGLKKEFGIDYFETPYKTYENRTMFGAKVPGSKQPQKYRVLLEAGIHARERGGPDHLLFFISDLLWANREGTGLVYGGNTYTPQDVTTALSMGIVVLPVVNPDGVAHDQATDSCWRKNRNPASSVPDDPLNSVGIDLNRNFSPVWNYTKHLAPGVEAASSDPRTELFYGTGPLSEPETQNVDWVMDQFSGLGWFVDQHSPATLVLYGWCHDSNQIRDKEMNLFNPVYDGKRGVVPDTTPELAYKEYMAQRDWDVLQLTAAKMAGGMSDSTGRYYRSLQAPHLYPSSGCSADHGNYRAAMDPSNRKKKTVYGFGVEFGESNDEVECPFYPTVEKHKQSMVEIGAAYMELLLTASRVERGELYQ